MTKDFKLTTGKKYEINIDGMSHEGQGIGRIDQIVVFVEGALKGEKVLAAINKVAKNYALASLEKILHPSPERINPTCSHAGQCGGCTLLHMSYEGQNPKGKGQLGADWSCESRGPRHFGNGGSLEISKQGSIPGG